MNKNTWLSRKVNPKSENGAGYPVFITPVYPHRTK
jgi:hypothetical protein